jgi:recombination protein RecA
VIFINQIRMKIGVMYGSPETTSGGNALKFYASVRLDIRRIQAIKTAGETLGYRTKVRVTKNKVAPPFREAEFDIMFAEGISKVGDILDIAVAQTIVDKRGAFFVYDGQRLGQGRENAKEYLKKHPEVATALEARIRATTIEAAAALPPRPGTEGKDESVDAEEIEDEE